MDAKFEPLAYLLGIICLFAILLGASHAEWQYLESSGVAALKSKRYCEAEALLTSALRSASKLNLSQQNVVISLNNLARLYTKMGKLEQAESLYRRSLCMQETMLDANDPALVVSLNNLALVLEFSGKYQEASQVYKRSVSIIEHELSHNQGSNTAAMTP